MIQITKEKLAELKSKASQVAKFEEGEQKGKSDKAKG